jgi:tetratricopeptide (TPR) repeat protein
LQGQGKSAEAEELLRKALAIQIKVLGKNHDHTASGYFNLAHCLNEQGTYTEAEALYRKALDIKRKVLRENHPNTASSYNSLAYNLNTQDRYAEAEEFYRRALNGYLQLIGGNDPLNARREASRGSPSRAKPGPRGPGSIIPTTRRDSFSSATRTGMGPHKFFR